jgi:pyruvate/2-oxoglutarate dehydrogenase complex dihydrolipoamide dehydrogenase (E3) component
MFRRFGSAVTVVQRNKQLLGREDPDVAGEVHKVLQEDGIQVLLETEATRVQAAGRGVVLHLRAGHGACRPHEAHDRPRGAQRLWLRRRP